MATLTNKQRFILNTLLSLAAILLGAGLLVTFINMSINQGTCELFRSCAFNSNYNCVINDLFYHFIG